MPDKTEADTITKTEGSPSQASGDGKGTDSAPPKKNARYSASIYPDPKRDIPSEFATLITKLEQDLGQQVWLIIQEGDSDLDNIGDELVSACTKASHELPKNEGIALLIDSYGGYAESAFRLARLLQRQCSKFIAIIPRRAKSAATLLALGAEKILMGTHAELGPLDVQRWDADREEYMSALDEVHALERLHAFSMDAIDQMTFLLLVRTRKKSDKLLPLILDFVAKEVTPLFDQIDAIHYTQMSRLLKVAEQYAVRLLSPRYPEKESKEIARHLVEKYPEHRFVIDANEARNIGLVIETPAATVVNDMDAIYHYLEEHQAPFTIIGKIKEEGVP